MPSRSDRLRFHDVRDAYRLIGECRDLGSDPVLWQQRMLDGLRRLLGTPAATGGEGRLVGPEGRIAPLVSLGSGLDREAAAVLGDYMRDGAVEADPLVRALGRMPGRPVTRTRRQAVPDRAYDRSPVVQRYLRAANVGHRVISLHPTAGGRGVSVIHLNRAPGERDFSPREWRLLAFFHAELGPLIGGALVSATEPSPEHLPPRLRQTLTCLLEGDSEKQAAARLGLSHATLHQYVTALYRRYGVRSRGQLVAHVLRRAARAGWRAP